MCGRLCVCVCAYVYDCVQPSLKRNCYAPTHGDPHLPHIPLPHTLLLRVSRCFMESPAGLIPAFTGQDCTVYDKTVNATYNGVYIQSTQREIERKRERYRENERDSYAHELFNYLDYFQLKRFFFLIKLPISDMLQSAVLSNVVSRVCSAVFVHIHVWYIHT